jgi:hypothetical protein
LATSTLSVSFSISLHLVTIYFMLQGNIFKKLRHYWNYQEVKIKGALVVLILFCIAINVSRYFMCIENSNIWHDFLFRLLMIVICTPSSIILEWTCFRLYNYYLELFQHKALQLINYGTPDIHDDEKCLSAYLGRGYLGHRELMNWSSSVES